MVEMRNDGIAMAAVGWFWWFAFALGLAILGAETGRPGQLVAAGMAGYGIGFIPGLGDFVAEYIDVILLAAVAGTLLITAWHYFRERAQAKKERLAGEAVTTHDEAEALVLDADVFERGPERHPHEPQDPGTATR